MRKGDIHFVALNDKSYVGLSQRFAPNLVGFANLVAVSNF